MNPEIKAKWVAALRGGEYKQGASQLRLGDRFCCLGVLCDLHAKAGKGEWVSEEYLESKRVLPDTVAEWAGLPGTNPDVPGSSNLAALNDDGMSFGKIADLIEKEL